MMPALLLAVALLWPAPPITDQGPTPYCGGCMWAGLLAPLHQAQATCARLYAIGRAREVDPPAWGLWRMNEIGDYAQEQGWVTAVVYTQDRAQAATWLRDRGPVGVVSRFPGGFQRPDATLRATVTGEAGYTHAYLCYSIVGPWWRCQSSVGPVYRFHLLPSDLDGLGAWYILPTLAGGD